MAAERCSHPQDPRDLQHPSLLQGSALGAGHVNVPRIIPSVANDDEPIPNKPSQRHKERRGGKRARNNHVKPQRKGLFTECCRRSLISSVLGPSVHREVEGALRGTGRGGLWPGLLHQKCSLSGERKEMLEHRRHNHPQLCHISTTWLPSSLFLLVFHVWLVYTGDTTSMGGFEGISGDRGIFGAAGFAP